LVPYFLTTFIIFIGIRHKYGLIVQVNNHEEIFSIMVAYFHGRLNVVLGKVGV